MPLGGDCQVRPKGALSAPPPPNCPQPFSNARTYLRTSNRPTTAFCDCPEIRFQSDLHLMKALFSGLCSVSACSMSTPGSRVCRPPPP